MDIHPASLHQEADTKGARASPNLVSPNESGRRNLHLPGGYLSHAAYGYFVRLHVTITVSKR